MQPYRPSSAVLQSIPLTEELHGIAAPEMMLKMTTYAPGKVGARHSHRGKPEVIYVLAGAIVDHRDDGSAEYREGQSCFVGNGAEHWMENRGDVPAVLLVAMVCDPS